MAWQAARPPLDFEWTRGYARSDVPALVAWSRSWVLYVAEYDGATAVRRLPRHPVVFVPEFVRMNPYDDEEPS